MLGHHVYRWTYKSTEKGHITTPEKLEAASLRRINTLSYILKDTYKHIKYVFTKNVNMLMNMPTYFVFWGGHFYIQNNP